MEVYLRCGFCFSALSLELWHGSGAGSDAGAPSLSEVGGGISARRERAWGSCPEEELKGLCQRCDCREAVDSALDSPFEHEVGVEPEGPPYFTPTAAALPLQVAANSRAVSWG